MNILEINTDIDLSSLSSRVLRNPRNIKMDNIMDRRPVLINSDLDKE